jgi:hypothetical protein
MKKIVAGLAALAMAASVFAVDVASMIQIDGDLMNYGSKTFKFLMAKEYDPSGDSDYLWKLSASGDKSGAEIWSWDIGSAVSSKKVWFKPADWLKITVGNVGDQSVANPQFGWWAQSCNNYAYGYQADLTFGAFSSTIALEPGAANYFFNSSATGFAKIGNFWIDAVYDIGGMAGKVQFVIAKGSAMGAHGVTGWKKADGLALGLAWTDMGYNQTGAYADAFVSFKADGSGLAFGGFDSQIGGQWMSNGIALRLTNVLGYWDSFKYGFEFKGSYALDSGWTPYVQIVGYDIMSKKMEADLGISGSVGSCTVTAWLALPFTFDSSYSFSFSVPLQFTLNL